MTDALALAGAACLGVPVGFSAARPRSVPRIVVLTGLSLAASFAALALAISDSAATAAVAGVLGGLAVRLLLDLYLVHADSSARRH